MSGVVNDKGGASLFDVMHGTSQSRALSGGGKSNL